MRGRQEGTRMIRACNQLLLPNSVKFCRLGSLAEFFCSTKCAHLKSALLFYQKVRNSFLKRFDFPKTQQFQTPIKKNVLTKDKILKPLTNTIASDIF